MKYAITKLVAMAVTINVAPAANLNQTSPDNELANIVQIL